MARARGILAAVNIDHELGELTDRGMCKVQSSGRMTGVSE
jgi:hypothetical protein